MEQTNILRQLHAIATGELQHAYNGMCPDQVEGPEVRDEDCPACCALLAADALLQR